MVRDEAKAFICENDYDVEISPEHQQEIRAGFSSDNSRHILLSLPIVRLQRAA